MDVFSAFPKAIITGTWKLGQIERQTEIGTKFTALPTNFGVIVDEIDNTNLHNTPDADGIETDTLLYAQPSQMPTTNIYALASDYLWYNSETDQYFDIIEVGVGKNQDAGVIEHYEFKLKPTEVAENGTN